MTDKIRISMDIPKHVTTNSLIHALAILEATNLDLSGFWIDGEGQEKSPKTYEDVLIEAGIPRSELEKVKKAGAGSNLSESYTGENVGLILAKAFVWSKAPQGSIYWHHLRTRLDENGFVDAKDHYQALVKSPE